MAKICPVCGGESPDNANFCVKCGTQHEQVKPAGEADALKGLYGLSEQSATTEEKNTEKDSNADSDKNPAVEAVLTPPAAVYEQPMVAETVPGVSEPTPAAAQENRSPSESTIDLIKKLDPVDDRDDCVPSKKSPYAPMTSVGTALSLIAMGIPLVGFIITIVWACGACRKISRRNLARAMLILMVLGIVLWVIAALVIRFYFAEDITKYFESIVPGYTINWG